jgi:hypothetical protein
MGSMCLMYLGLILFDQGFATPREGALDVERGLVLGFALMFFLAGLDWRIRLVYRQQESSKS